VRRDAAQALGQIGDTRAVEPLVTALGLKDKDLRCRAAEAMEKIGTPAIEPLVAVLQGSDKDVRQAVIAALLQIGEPAVKSLVAALPEPAAAEVLCRIGAPAVEPLIVALEKRNAVAAQVLGKIGDTRSIEALVGALNYADERVRQAAIKALRQIGSPAIERLVALLTHYESRNWAEDALGQMGGTAVEPLVAVLKNSSSNVRASAARALAEIGDIRAVEPLIANLEDVGTAAYALGQLGDPRAVEPLINTLGNKDWHVRRAAAHALGQLGDPRAVEPLVAALNDGHKNVRVAAAEGLGKLGAPAVRPLIAVLKGNDTTARQAVSQALVTLYQSGKLDKTHQRLILMKRSEIVNKSHTDRDLIRGGSDCHSETYGHEDSVLPFLV
jgi:HEAT repeat protein